MARIGPGLVTGASDDDPSGIATYSQVGSQFGLGMLWTMLFSYPLMGGIQEISARVGLVTGRGLAGNLRKHFPRGVTYGVVALLVLANTINIGADLGAMAAALHLLVGGPILAYTVGFGLLCVGLQVFIPYRRYVPYLKWLCMALLAYVGILFVEKIPWVDVFEATLLPRLRLTRASLTAIVAIFGTTISPYLFFWQASQEVEEQRAHPAESPLKTAPEQGDLQLGRMRSDTWIGMAFSNLVAYFIILTAAIALNARGTLDIQTSTQAAEALRPVAGRFAFLLFSLGIIGTGLLAVPVLAGASAYAVGESRRWAVGLEKTPLAAWRFYAVIAVSTLVGILLNVIHLDPVRALFWSAVVNGVVAAPIMVMIMLLASRRKVMGTFELPLRLKILGWTATSVMAAVTVAMFATMGH
ncbi:MAG TPA: divalent metal cation transporter [Vicinamibacteria bacterium]|nr:divalent metal cation transporter [Vicinamibacteria bacterium]